MISKNEGFPLFNTQRNIQSFGKERNSFASSKIVALLGILRQVCWQWASVEFSQLSDHFCSNQRSICHILCQIRVTQSNIFHTSSRLLLWLWTKEFLTFFLNENVKIFWITYICHCGWSKNSTTRTSFSCASPTRW